MRTSLFGALFMIAFSGCKHESRVSETTLRSAEARARGRQLFLEHCALCHGDKADGNGRRREGLTGRPVDFTSARWRASATPDGVFAVIREGKHGTSMPAWPSLGDPEVTELTAYVLSVQAEGP
jgi:mono/diheme cytochrome c family protein